MEEFHENAAACMWGRFKKKCREWRGDGGAVILSCRGNTLCDGNTLCHLFGGHQQRRHVLGGGGELLGHGLLMLTEDLREALDWDSYIWGFHFPTGRLACASAALLPDLTPFYDLTARRLPCFCRFGQV